MCGAVSVALLALALTVPSAAGGERGATPAQIVLGATAPLTGDDTATAAIVRGAEAYFRHVNAGGGVHGRTIHYRIVDDAGDPERTRLATQQLVERDGVLAIVGSPGTEESLAARDYLNGVRVPQLFVASGAGTLTRDAAGYPWTIGYQPRYAAEGRIYGRYVTRVNPAARLALLVQAEPDSEELLAGLRAGVAGSGVRIVAAGTADPFGLDLRAQVGTLRASGADAFAVFAEPGLARRAVEAARGLGWRPLAIADSRSITARPLTGTVVASFLKRPGDPRWARDPGMRLYRSILARYGRGARAADVLHVYGMAVAYTTVEVLRAAGPNPTRASLMARARSLTSASNPFLLPGITVRTSRTDGTPIDQAVLERWTGRTWAPLGGLWSAAG
jgi:branched-chain amino acid transport system substrate-binding protein